VHLSSDLVAPALRGSFGREYHHAESTPTTQRMLPGDAAHGAVALAEHQTAGRGRLGRVWVDRPGTGLTFSVALYPPLPVARWPELTVVAANAVAGAVGQHSVVEHPNDVLLEGRKVAGILAEACDRVVLGIGVNVGSSPWPGAGWVDRDRLELLVDVLDRLEHGYGEWLGGLTTVALTLPAASCAPAES
jgi:BirA family transcriptional regulator, biotin operon repressor / biotin---[acetyl-CoA-carboxylase] ligase